jgi:iron-sulfur cluster assembly accessory protein
MDAAKQTITLTDKAVEAVKLAITEEGLDGSGLRVAVVGGGCSGYSYALDFSDEFDEDDMTLDFNGLPVYLDPHSAQLLTGVEIDYIETLQRKGFVFNNPNATTTCGCGSSFS